jgi:hypothetical protein
MTSTPAFRLNSLISVDFAELHRVIDWVLGQLKQNDEKLSELRKMQGEMKESILKHDSSIKDLQLTAVTFNRGLDDLNAMKDKMDAWSERFRILEEKNLGSINLIQQTSRDFQTRTDEIKQKHDRDIEELRNRLRNEFSEAGAREKERNDKHFKEIKQQLGNFQLDNQASIQKLDKGFNSKITYLQGLLDLSVQSSEHVFSPAATDSILESHQPHSPAFLDRDDIVVNTERIEIPAESNKGIKEIKERVTNLEAIIASLNQRLESEPKENASVYIQDIFKRIYNIENNLKETKVDDERDSLQDITPQRIDLNTERSQSETHLRRQNSEVTTNQASKTYSDELVNESAVSAQVHISSRAPKSSRRFSVLDEKVDIIKNQLEKLSDFQSNFVSKPDLQQIMKKLKHPDTAQKSTAACLEEHTHKIHEFESRLNGLWRANKELVDLLDTLQSKQNILSNIPSAIKEESEQKIGKVENKLNEIQESFKDKLGNIRSDLEKVYQDINPSEIEAVFRSNFLSLRGEINVIKASVQELEEKNAFQNGFFDKASESQVEMDGSSEAQIKNILKQHESAIRAIANKLSVNTNLIDFHENKRAEHANYLIHLEDLRKEMKEMISKQDNTKSLSSKDMELLHAINSALNTKISRDELATKVDKPELRKTYILLKKKIDEISTNLKKAETLPTSSREDAYFLKKRLDVECAACGQHIPESSDLVGMQYQPWNRLPTRYHIPGFSRLLNSLIVNPSGEVALPSRKEARTVEIVSPKSKCPTPTVRKTGTRKSVLAKLPQLNNV